MDTTVSSGKTDIRSSRGETVSVLPPTEDATRGSRQDAGEIDRTRWEKASNHMIRPSDETASQSAFAVSRTTAGAVDEPRLVEVHEFIIAGMTDTHATMEISVGDSTKTFLALIKGLEEIGVISPSVGDRFKLNILKTPAGFVSRAIKISSAGGLAFPKVAPPFDPNYADYLKKHLGLEEHE